MKKTFAFVLAIILLCPVALADTLREQVNAPMEHKGTYSSPSGRSHIYVDAQVIVPEAETIPIYQAFARVPDEMEFKLLADLAFGEGGYTLEEGKTDASNPAGVTYAEGDPAETAKGFHKYCISTDLRSASLLHQQEDFSYVQAYYGIWDYAKTHMLSPTWSISPPEAISEKTCRRRQTQGSRQTRLYLRYFRIFSSGGQRIKRI